MKTHLTKLTFVLLIFGGLFFQQCGSSKTTTSVKANVTPITYETDIKPIMVTKCTPCHFPETGRKKLLHTLEATKENVDAILYRVQLAQEEVKFMPFKSKKPALTTQEIKKFKDWVEQGTPK